MYEISDSLDKSWSREVVLTKIKSGQPLEKIVNEFLNENKSEINKFVDLIHFDNYKMLDNLISLSECELKLIKKLKDLEKNKFNNKKFNESNLPSKKDIKIDLSLFMKKWSNKFVIITLITISLISLTKQAWA